MDNLKLPAHPIGEKEFHRFSEQMAPWTGFTKLELAALMIAQGLMANHRATPNQYHGWVAEPAVAIAKAVLEEANK